MKPVLVSILLVGMAAGALLGLLRKESEMIAAAPGMGDKGKPIAVAGPETPDSAPLPLPQIPLPVVETESSKPIEVPMLPDIRNLPTAVPEAPLKVAPPVLAPLPDLAEKPILPDLKIAPFKPMPTETPKPMPMPAKAPELIALPKPPELPPEMPASENVGPDVKKVAPKPIEKAPEKVVEPPTPPLPSTPLMPLNPVREGEFIGSRDTKASNASARVMPMVSIEAKAPDSLSMGTPWICEIIVRNEGTVPVTGVRVEEILTRGLEYVTADPPADTAGDRVSWSLDTMDAGSEKKIRLTLRATTDGLLKIRPSVSFTGASQPVMVKVMRPKIDITIESAEVAWVGEEIPTRVTLRNIGNGTAREVRIQARLSDGLNHAQLRDRDKGIETTIAGLAPGESKTLPLMIQATRDGSQLMVIHADVDAIPRSVAERTIKVSPPTLTLNISGQSRCAIDSQPIWTLEIANTDSRPSAPIQLATAFPEGLEFNSASDSGSYDALKRTATWNLGILPPNTRKSVTVRTKAERVGTFAVRSVAQAGSRVELKAETTTNVEGVPGVAFEVVALENPVVVGKETAYEVRIRNRGSVNLTGLQIAASLSEGQKTVRVDGATVSKVIGQIVMFEPIAKLATRADMRIVIRVQSTVEGDQRCRVQLTCDQLKQPLVKEESIIFSKP